jgi:hypothetical protein
VFSSTDHNDPESWKDWADKDKQEERITRFKRKLAPEKTDKTDPLSILVVINMLLTGFDASVEPVGRSPLDQHRNSGFAMWSGGLSTLWRCPDVCE